MKIFICGVPRSGKSTMAKLLKTQIENSNLIVTEAIKWLSSDWRKTRLWLGAREKQPASKCLSKICQGVFGLERKIYRINHNFGLCIDWNWQSFTNQGQRRYCDLRWLWRKRIARNFQNNKKIWKTRWLHNTVFWSKTAGWQ